MTFKTGRQPQWGGNEVSRKMKVDEELGRRRVTGVSSRERTGLRNEKGKHVKQGRRRRRTYVDDTLGELAAVLVLDVLEVSLVLVDHGLGVENTDDDCGRDGARRGRGEERSGNVRERETGFVEKRWRSASRVAAALSISRPLPSSSSASYSPATASSPLLSIFPSPHPPIFPRSSSFIREWAQRCLGDVIVPAGKAT